MKQYAGAIFDLDGVIVDTARYHYLAWKRLAGDLGFAFTEEHNERLKGVSRLKSLDILLELGRLNVDDKTRQVLADRKNSWYVEYLLNMDESELLPGARELLLELERRHIPRALGTASRNAGLILDRLQIRELFAAVIDGTMTAAAKPDPEVFLKGASALGLRPSDCVVFEDAAAGIEAARAAGMGAVGLGKPSALPGADMWIPCLKELDSDLLFLPAWQALA